MARESFAAGNFKAGARPGRGAASLLVGGAAALDCVPSAQKVPAASSRPPAHRPLAAAGQWGRVVGGRPPFEEIALQLVDAGDPDALAMFLKTKLQVRGVLEPELLACMLACASCAAAATPPPTRPPAQVLGRNDKAQSTLVASWLCELLLDAANHAALEAGGDDGEPGLKAAVDALRSFLSDYAEVLDVGTTTGLLASYGAPPPPVWPHGMLRRKRMRLVRSVPRCQPPRRHTRHVRVPTKHAGRLEELQHFAAARGDDEALLEYLMRADDGGARLVVLPRETFAALADGSTARAGRCRLEH